MFFISSSFVALTHTVGSYEQTSFQRDYQSLVAGGCGEETHYSHVIEHLSTEIWEDQEGTIIISIKRPI